MKKSENLPNLPTFMGHSQYFVEGCYYLYTIVIPTALLYFHPIDQCLSNFRLMNGLCFTLLLLLYFLRAASLIQTV